MQRRRDVGSGDVVFSTLGFMGLYLLLGILFLYLVGRQLQHGPTTQPAPPPAGATAHEPPVPTPTSREPSRVGA